MLMAQIVNRRATSGNLCIFCRLARHSIDSLNGAETSPRLTSTFSGSRGLHAGSPAKRPPAESQASSRSAWVRTPTFDDSTLNAFLKSRREGTEGQNLPDLSKPNQEEMGKWARRSPNWSPAGEKSWEGSTARQKGYNAIDSQLRGFRGENDTMAKVTPTLQRNLPPRPSFNSGARSDQAPAPRINSTPEPSRSELSSLPSQLTPETAARKAPTSNLEAEAPSQTTPFPPSYRYAEVVKSRKSAADIENDLFAGIKSEIPTPESSGSQAQVNTQSSSFSNLLTSFGQDSRSSDARTNTSYTKASQPFRVSERSVRDAMEAAKRSEERRGTTGINPTPERPVQQFGFMAARMRPSTLPTEANTPPPYMAQAEAELPEDIQRISSSQWHSSSREQWSYEVETKKAEAEAAEAQALVNEVSLEKTLTPEQLKIKRRKEVSALRKKAKGKKFLVDMQDLGLWEEQKTKVEALPDIKIEKNLFIPPSISVVNFADLLKIPLETLQKKMELLGLEPEQCAYDYGTNLCGCI